MAKLHPNIFSLESNEEDLKVSQDVLKPWKEQWKWWSSYTKLGKLPKVVHLLGSPSLAPRSISIICGEPFSRDCEALPCDSQLWNHWAQVDALRFSLSSECIFLPRAFRVKVALLRCKDLWRRRQAIGGLLHGVDVSAINALHPEADLSASGPIWRRRFPCGLWQVEHLLGRAAVLCTVDMEREAFPVMSRNFGTVTLNSEGDVDGLATWTEVNFTEGLWLPTLRLSNNIPSGEMCVQPSPMMQGILLAKNPGGGTVTVQSCFEVEDGTLSLRAAWDDGREF